MCSTFFQASSRAANRSLAVWPWTPKAQIDMLLGKNCQKLTYLPNLPTLGKGNKSCSKKNTWEKLCKLVLEVRYLYPFYSKNICHLGFPSYLSSKLGLLESKVGSIPAMWRELRVNESPYGKNGLMAIHSYSFHPSISTWDTTTPTMNPPKHDLISLPNAQTSNKLLVLLVFF